MSAEYDRIKILGSFLKSRRERLQPESAEVVGRMGRRRTPGLRREEVAHLAGVSITWYTWLEQGRVVNVSREVIESIGRALQLSSDERVHLLRLANCGGGEAVEPGPEAGEIPSGLQGLIDQIYYPAIIANYRTEVLAYNGLATEAITNFRELPDSQRVMTKLMFTDSQLRRRLVNWQEAAEYTLGYFRSYYDQKTDDPWFAECVQELSEDSEEFRSMWSQHHISHKKSIPFTLDHPAAGKLHFQLNSFSNINGDAHLHCCVFTPVPGTGTEQQLAVIRA